MTRWLSRKERKRRNVRDAKERLVQTPRISALVTPKGREAVWSGAQKGRSSPGWLIILNRAEDRDMARMKPIERDGVLVRIVDSNGQKYSMLLTTKEGVNAIGIMMENKGAFNPDQELVAVPGDAIDVSLFGEQAQETSISPAVRGERKLKVG